MNNSSKHILLILLKFNNQSELPKENCSLVTDV
jgi:hypothetical protein